MTLCYEMSNEELVELNHPNDENDNMTAQRLERQDLFVSRADTVLRPLFLYCQYELKQAGQATMEEPRSRRHRSADATKDVTDVEDAVIFRDQELVLDNKELRVLLLKLQSLDQESKDAAEDSNETQFLTALSILDEALEVVLSLEKGLAKLNTGPTVQARLEQYALWKGYLQYTKTQKVMDHTEKLLVAQNIAGTGAMGPAEKVHVYDSLLQHARTLLTLPRPGQENFAAEEDEYALQIQANILRLRALKSYQMGWFYYTQLHNYAAAYVLIEHSAKLCKRAQEEIAACDEDMPRSDEYLSELEELPLESAISAIRAAMALQQRLHARMLKRSGAKGVSSMSQDVISTDRPLLLRLYDLDIGTLDAPIADLRPIPLPCKPVFYDLAYDYALDPVNSIDAVEAFVHEHTVSAKFVDDGYDEGTKNNGTNGKNWTGLFGWFTGS
jgi:hypothetical protein